MNARRPEITPRPTTLLARAAAAACLCIGGLPAAQAVEIATGVDDLSVRWDNTFRYNLGTRVDGRDGRIANNPLFDEGDYRFGKGDITTDRLDILSELEADWNHQFGVRFSGSAWYDDAYKDSRVRQNPEFAGLPTGYSSGSYSGYTKRYYNGPSAELLDAFAYASIEVGHTPVNIKVGKHTVYWGNADFATTGISYSQQPIDGRKGAETPGTEVRELFLPLTQISAQSQLTRSFSVAAQYYLDWDHIRIPEGGTFLGPANFLLDGANQFVIPTSATTPPIVLARTGESGPSHKAGNWGINGKWTAESLEATTFGLYYRHFDEKMTPWVNTVFTSATGGTYNAVYPRGTSIVGLSMDTTVGPLGVGAELLSRRNAGLNSTAVDPVSNQGARGNVWHALVNASYVLPTTFLSPTGQLAAELTYDRLDKVTKNAALYDGVGTTACGSLGVDSGCATKDAIGFNILLTPQYPQAFSGIDLSFPLSFGGGVHGNTADFGGTNQGNYTYSAGVTLDIHSQWNVSLLWADSTAKIISEGNGAFTGNGNWQTTDRGRVSLTVKTSL